MATIKDYATLSNLVYQANGGTPDPSSGWVVYATPGTLGMTIQSGYYGVAYRNVNTNEIVLAHRGTQLLTDTGDLKSDWQILAGQTPSQFPDAEAFYAAVLNKAVSEGLQVSSISQTGHSLGGAIARELAIANGETAALFNAPGYANGTPLPALVSPTQILSINAFYDVVSEYGRQVGTVKEVYVSSFPFIPDKFEVLAYLPVFGPFSWFQALRFGFSQHSMDNLLEVIQALPVGSLGFPADSAGLDFSADYEITGTWLDEWQSFEDVVSSIASQVPTGPLAGSDLTAEVIQTEQSLNPAVARQFTNVGDGSVHLWRMAA